MTSSIDRTKTEIQDREGLLIGMLERTLLLRHFAKQPSDVARFIQIVETFDYENGPLPLPGIVKPDIGETLWWLCPDDETGVLHLIFSVELWDGTYLKHGQVSSGFRLPESFKYASFETVFRLNDICQVSGIEFNPLVRKCHFVTNPKDERDTFICVHYDTDDIPWLDFRTKIQSIGASNAHRAVDKPAKPLTPKSPAR